MGSYLWTNEHAFLLDNFSDFRGVFLIFIQLFSKKFLLIAFTENCNIYLKKIQEIQCKKAHSEDG